MGKIERDTGKIALIEAAAAAVAAAATEPEMLQKPEKSYNEVMQKGNAHPIKGQTRNKTK